MSGGSGYSVTEQDLFRVDTLGDTDLVRVVQNGASRNVVYASFVDDLEDRLAGSFGNLRSFQTVTAGLVNISVTSPEVTFCDASAGDVTVSLPTAVSAVTGASGRLFTFKKISDATNNVIIQPQAGELVENDTEIVLLGSDLPAVSVLSDGLKWWLVNA